MRLPDFRKYLVIFLIMLLAVGVLSTTSAFKSASATPFYGLSPKPIVLRASFSTSYASSSPERKQNIRLAAKLLDKTLVGAGEEFSFNATVGKRTESRGFKQAKIIKDGLFVAGVGGGVCQVSTTLYNALLLAGLKITEFHPHSLAVSYVAPSFDAMVNDGWADLRFENNTENPVYLLTNADDTKITVKIFGEKSDYLFKRRSVTVEKLPPLGTKTVYDAQNNYNLKAGESLTLSYPKEGVISEGYVDKIINGKVVESRKIRRDRYSPTCGVIIRPQKKNAEKPTENI